MANTTPYIINTAGNKSALDKVIAGGIVIGGLWYGKKLYDDWRASKELDKAGSDPNAQAATKIHQAVDGAGTAEKELFNIATTIKDWAAVSKSYRTIYKTDMLADIKGDLSPEDYDKFLNIYNLSTKPGSGKNQITPGMWVFVEKAANVRRSPKVITTTDSAIVAAKNYPAMLLKSAFFAPLAMYRTATGVKNNIISLAPANKYVGIITGRTTVDTETKSGTLFIEIKIGVVDSKGKSTLVNAWIASSQVRTEQLAKGAVGSNLTYFFQESYDNALGLGLGLNGIGANSNYKSEIAVKGQHAAIYNEKGELWNHAHGKGLILGFKEYETEKNGNRMYVFKSAQGLTRLVKVNEVVDVKTK